MLPQPTLMNEQNLLYFRGYSESIFAESLILKIPQPECRSVFEMIKIPRNGCPDIIPKVIIPNAKNNQRHNTQCDI